MEPISKGKGNAMIAVAVVIDILSIIPLVNTAADIAASFIFGFWFWHLGVNAISKRPFRFMGTIVAEFFPGLSALPIWTIYIWWTLREIQRESAV